MVTLYKSKFYFPFSYDAGEFDHLKVMESSIWTNSPLPRPTDPSTYATYRYFHPHTRELLYSEGDRASIRHFNVKSDHIKDWFVQVTPHGKPPVTVNLNSVSAMLFDLHVGILCISLTWDAHNVPIGASKTLEFNDVLNLNNLFRRSCPPFISYDPSEQKPPFAGPVRAANEIPQAIRIGSNLDEPVIEEDFGHRFDRQFANDSKTHKTHEFIGNHFLYWLQHLAAGVRISGGRPLNAHKPLCPVLDERNYVTSFVIDDQLQPQGDPKSRNLHTIVTSPTNPFAKLSYETQDARNDLYRYVFVEPAAFQYTSNPDFCDQLLVDSLYMRYRDMGTYYGFTRYSGTFLFGTKDDWFPRNILIHHYDGMYHMMASLIVAERAILLEISERCANVSNDIENLDNFQQPQLVADVRELRKDFLLYNNKYWFNEVTSQEQGIEMFQLWSTQSGNQTLFNEVEAEVRALHDFTQMRVNDSLNKLTYLSIAGVAISLCALFFQTDFQSVDNVNLVSLTSLAWIALLTGLTLTVLTLLTGRFLVGFPSLTSCLWNWLKSFETQKLERPSEGSPLQRGVEPGRAPDRLLAATAPERLTPETKRG